MLGVLLLVGAAAAEPPQFAAPFFSHDAGFDGKAVAIADLNVDGDPDVLILTSLGLEVRLGGGDGTLGPPTIFPAGNRRMLVVGDLDGDDVPDVVTGADSLHVGVLIGNGNGTFQPMVSYPVAMGPAGGVLAYLNADAALDLVCSAETANKVTILLGDGLGGFNSRTDVSTGSRPGPIAAGDLDHDGDLDVVVLNRLSLTITRLLGNGAGALAAAGSAALPANAETMALADLNGDTWLDAVAGSTYTPEFFVVPGLVGGAFGTVASHATDGVTWGLVAADFDGDGRPDVALLDYYLNRGEVRRSLGAFAFAGPQPFTTVRGAWGIAVGDLNGGGKPDLVTICQFGPFSVHMGNGDGTFGGVADVAVGSYPWSVGCGDLNGDDYTDLVTANSGDATLTVRFGSAGGAFGAPLTLATGVEPRGVTIADAEGDGDMDLIVAENGPGTQTSSTVAVFLGDGTGSFAPRVPYTVARWAQQVAVGDLNGDQLPDLAVACADDGTITIRHGVGNGVFGVPHNFIVGDNGSGTGVAIADVTRDGKPDVLLSDYGAGGLSGGVYILPGNANGTYQSLFGLSLPLARGVAAADVAGDSAPDVIVSTNSGVSVFPSTSGELFVERLDYTGGNGPLTVADFDGDGRIDVATANNWPSNSVSVWPGQSGGGLGPAIAFGAGDRPLGVGTGDVNGDGLVDLVASNMEGNSVSLLLNTGGLTWRAWVGVPPVPNAPRTFELHAAPNPASGPGTIRYTLARPARVRLRLLDVAGRQLALLDQGERPAGRQSLRWNARELRAEVGFLELQVDAERVVRRVAIVH